MFTKVSSAALMMALLGSALGCVHATPVAAAPVSEEEAPKLQAALVGTCAVTATQSEGGDKKSDPGGLTFTFGPDHQASYHALWITNRYTYKVEGRNVIMDGPYKTFRVDDWSTSELKWFVYDLSKTFYCSKR